ncbi:AGAP006216-PA-like protein [Anopheles sinensis]|uniref:AGAP006216-PA-like protein n=1 Tax=Anopheles sinensis TaxID=74873 RepID=A0A084WK39_ANOSI|nr:AGAP006216-PA-like protein [Anopheles sinensis]
MTKSSSYQRVTIRQGSGWCLWQRIFLCVMVALCCGTGELSFGISDVRGALLCLPEESVNITDGTVQEDGSIVHDDIRYGPEQYFNINSDVFGCVCLVRQCILIYCEDQTTYPSGTECPLEELQVNVSTAASTHTLVDILNNPRYHLIFRTPHCSPDRILGLPPQDYVLQSDGRLAYGPSLFNYRQFALMLENKTGETLAAYCEMEDVQAHHQWYSIGILVSLPFMVATFVVYALLPELQNIPGKSLMCYVASLTVGYLLLALMRFSLYEHQSGWCIGTAYIVYFALLASFFWLNVQAFDIYWTFGGSRGRTSERRKFLYYSLYAWGVPLTLLAFVLLVDHTDFMDDKLRPLFGHERCLFRGRLSRANGKECNPPEGVLIVCSDIPVAGDKLIGFVYMYLPLALLVGANVFFFGMSAFRIYRMQQSAATALSGDSRRHTKYEKDRYR